MTKTDLPAELLDRIRSANRLLLTSHTNPDGDAIGSELGLARLLRSIGKSAVIWNRDETPNVYRNLPGSNRIHTGSEPPAGYPEQFDAAVVLECPGLDRCGLEEAVAELPILNIDHHLGNQHYGAVNWVDPSAPAVGEMIFRLARAMHLVIDEETATALHLTLVTDTGGFRYSNATPAAFEEAAELVREGARPERVAHWLYESQPLAAMRLVGEMLGTLELHADGRIATASVDQAMFERAGASAGDSEGLTDYPRSIAGVEASALLREIGEDHYKVSLRSRGETSVVDVAREHGGGGHRNAAGCEVRGSRAQVIAAIVEELTAIL